MLKKKYLKWRTLMEYKNFSVTNLKKNPSKINFEAESSEEDLWTEIIVEDFNTAVKLVEIIQNFSPTVITTK